MLESPAADRLANSSSADGSSTLNCQGMSEPFTKFQIKTSSKGMEARLKQLTIVAKKLKELLFAKVLISKLMAI